MRQIKNMKKKTNKKQQTCRLEMMSVQGERYQIGGEESEMSASAGDLPHLPTSLSLSVFFRIPLQ